MFFGDLIICNFLGGLISWNKLFFV